MRQKANYDILEGFISTLLDEDITIINLPESEANSQQKNDKINIVDILCEDMKGDLFLIELQYNSEIDYFQRMLFGTSKIITDYMTKGSKYTEVKKVYSINIVYFDLGQGTDYVYHGTTKFVGINKQDQLSLNHTQVNLFDKKDVAELYPEYFIIKVNNFDNNAVNSLDEWIYYFKNNDLPLKYKAKGLEMVSEKLKYDKMSNQLKSLYDAHQKELAVSFSVLETARLEGELRGEIKGEIKAKRQLIQNAMKSGFSIPEITKFFGMSEDEINDILIYQDI